jgi:hypothetical protein
MRLANGVHYECLARMATELSQAASNAHSEWINCLPGRARSYDLPDPSSGSVDGAAVAEKRSSRHPPCNVVTWLMRWTSRPTTFAGGWDTRSPKTNPSAADRKGVQRSTQDGTDLPKAIDWEGL